MAAARAPRIGLFGYAACLAAELVLALWNRHILAAVRGGETFERVRTMLDLVGYGYMAAGVATVIALVAVAGAPRAARVSRVAIGAAVGAAIGVALDVGQRVYIAAGASGNFDRMEQVLRLLGAGRVLADTVTSALVVIVAVRVGRVVGARAMLPIAIGALAALAVGLGLYLVTLALGRGASIPEAVFTVHTVAYYASAAFVGAAAIHAGRSLARMPVTEPPTPDGQGPADALSPRWRSAADGISLYLGGAAARVVCALLGYAAMAGSGGATSTSDLRGVHDSVLGVAVLSGVASLVMLAGVWRITRAPPESEGTGAAMATLCLMVLGLTLDLVTTSITLDALGGSLSAAFFAMDALPVLAFGAALLGVGAGIALLRSFGNMAQVLGAAELQGRAKSATGLLVVAGGIAGLAMLGLKKMPVEVLGVIAVVVLPLAVAALVQFLRVAVPLGRVIRGRLGEV
jgi:hypothetical protein